MTEHPTLSHSSPPALPEPQRERWQPLRLGLVELFHYDSEEFWFHDGHLLLRGNNGSGKSKVLSLTLPLLFDAQLRPSRVEPDGDAGKKMAWNLLMGDRYPRRIGYSWIEFGRREREGRTRYLTLGVGLSAVAGRAQVESWFFLLEGHGDAPDPRLGQDLWLTTADHHVISRERLRDAIAGRGLMFENNAQGYRRAVDERLFHLGTQRYAALMDTLIQLRQPQLSKKPDESGLSNALSESLPPLPVDLLGDVAEALNQLEEDRNQLQDIQRLEQTVSRFEQCYRFYAGMLARRQARELRQAQTGFDKASEARNRAQADCDAALSVSQEAATAAERAKQASVAARERLETLQSDPANQDANRLARAEEDARRRGDEARAAGERSSKARELLQRESGRSQRRAESAGQARIALETCRAQAFDRAAAVGLDNEFVAHPLFASPVDALTTRALSTVDDLRDATRRRHHDIALLHRRHAEADRRQVVVAERRNALQVARTETGDALERREQADHSAESAGESLAQAWAGHCAALRYLRFDADEPLRQLAEWTARLEGDNPAQGALHRAWRIALQNHAARTAELDAQRQAQRLHRSELDAERERLLAGETPSPPSPPTRAADARTARAGAPLWQVVDFRPQLDAAERAGLEAALESSGLLDAWLSPQGELVGDDGCILLDCQWQRRAAVIGASLSDVLLPTPPDDCGLTADTIAALLAGIAYGAQDRPEAESWLAPDGRFRLGALAGAWAKSAARYIGHAARERARRERLDLIALALEQLDAADAELAQRFERLAAERDEGEREWQGAPSDMPLREAVAAALAAAGEVERARARLALAEQRSREAEGGLHDAREQLRRDATDLHLPIEAERLPQVESALQGCEQALVELIQAARDWQRAWPEHLEQQQREAEAFNAAEEAEEARILAEERAGQARSHFETLRRSIGQRVEVLRAQLSAARDESRRAEETLDRCRDAASEAGKAHAVASARAEQAEQALADRIAVRADAVERLRQFTASGLLVSALPEQELPAQWSVDPALNLARRIEQALARIDDNEQAWNRVQKQISEDLGELQRGLGTLGHQAISEPNDFGLTVSIQYQNRAERPDALARLLAEDIAQRSELLSAREREVLENHLQAEIATEIQRLMRAADERVKAINAELYKRPTTTGVRYKLRWEPLSVEEGAPAGLEQARESLLNTSADLWSPEDRRTVGEMLQQQIAAERARADADSVGGSLIDQLAHALDYRHWHRFRIQRLQDGQWRKLSGPASSGERALGLTVPLFAAAASFYEHGGSRLAPRLMLLDEAFAGIDDAARAHCMGLVREFDLDFVITSEREWACYAELPGVSICQLQRQENIDAVFVSRWLWDGSARRIQDDPDRRFPSA
ncbi:TIGR02680 family protein [Pseudoxanthomonas winnipegensis]|uniref:TIGR02680 family protein n=1 Tax=Pseudoxanthomonas winnipegensis TaxID=2480810 RepID=UPI0030F36F63